MEKKKRDVSETKEKLKKGAIIVLPVAFALVAAISAALLVGGMRTAPEGETAASGGESSTPMDVPVAVPPESNTETEYSKGLEYRSNSDGTCAVTGIGSCTDRIIRIPEQSPEGLTVIGIGDRAFMGVSAVSEVKLPNSVMTVGNEAFKGSGITVMNIGSSVLSVGEGAFSGCLSLAAINVDGANAMLSSVGGVLFDREMTTLKCYPSGKADTTYVIPKSVTRIATEAFSSCKNLSKVKYAGTEKQWKDVYVCVGNDSLDINKMTFAPEEK